MTSQTNLRHLIREMLLQEEVFGAQAIVYHGTKADPRILIDAILNNDFRAGTGAGAYYGKGLYSVYDLTGGQTNSGGYGSYVLKLKINLYGYIIFDPDVAVQVYGSALTPTEQAAKVGLSQSIVDMLKAYRPPAPGALTSEGALWASKFLQYDAKGIVYTGGNDGRCALVYDPSTIVPMAWKKIKERPPKAPADIIAMPVDTWFPVTRDESGEFRPEIRAAAARSASGEYEEGKYDTRTPVQRERDEIERKAAKNVAIVADSRVDLVRRKRIAQMVPVGEIRQYMVDNISNPQINYAALCEGLSEHPDLQVRSFALLGLAIEGQSTLSEDELADLVINLDASLCRFLYNQDLERPAYIPGRAWPRAVQRALVIAMKRSAKLRAQAACQHFIKMILTSEPQIDELLQLLTDYPDAAIRSEARLAVGSKEDLEETLSAAADSGGWEALVPVIKSRILDEDIKIAALRMIMDRFSNEKFARLNVATCWFIPPDLQARLVGDDFIEVLRALAQNEATLPEHLGTLARNNEQGVALAIAPDIARNQNTSSETLAYLAANRIPEFQARLPGLADSLGASVASREATPQSQLRVLATNDRETIRRGVAYNRNAPPDVLADLANDTSNVIKFYVSTNPSTPPEVLGRIENGEIKGLVSESDPNIHKQIAMNPSASEAALRFLSSNPSSEIRAFVAMHPNTAVDVLQTLAKDKSRKVSSEAKAKLKARKSVTNEALLRRMIQQLVRG